jgi:hypothetical protein
MNPIVWLMLMSFALVAPVMFVLLWASMSGTIGRDEDARYLPLNDPDEDVWDVERGRGPEGDDR